MQRLLNSADHFDVNGKDYKASIPRVQTKRDTKETMRVAPHLTICTQVEWMSELKDLPKM
jgi:hypothetical protein